MCTTELVLVYAYPDTVMPLQCTHLKIIHGVRTLHPRPLTKDRIKSFWEEAIESAALERNAALEVNSIISKYGGHGTVKATE